MKLKDEHKQFIDELSALSGIQKDVIKEVLEFQIIWWAEKLAKDPDKFTRLNIPYMGTVAIKYNPVEKRGEEETPPVTAFVSLEEGFEKMVEDIYYESHSVAIDLLKKKIRNIIGFLRG